MIKAKDGDFFVTDWLRNRNTLEYLGIWEKVNNPNFNYGEFAIIKNKSGLNNFKISVKEFAERTNAISLQAKAGRYGGTYAQKDIAFEFAMWISPEFKIYLVNEFQRLKEEEQKQIGWTAKRELAKLGLAKPENIKDGAVVRVEKAYPVYDPGYQANVDIIRAALTPFANLQPVGRNGLHKYNNQDHSMMTAILAVKNLRGAKFNLWQVNSDAEYHEEVRSSEDTSGRLVPRQLSAKPGA